MASLTYLRGDATLPKGLGTKVICHCVNDVGAWGSGFVLALDKWPRVKRAYVHWHFHKTSPLEIPLGSSPDGLWVPFRLGEVQFVQVEPELWVANIVGQHRTIREGERVPVRYEALEAGFDAVATFCKRRDASSHMPKIGAGLAKGNWRQIEPILEHRLVSRGISATVYVPV